MQFHKKKLGQVWIESVLYTLIGLTLIGIALAIVTPKIAESRDRILVEQTINLMNEFNEKVDIVIDTGPSNKRKIDDFSMRKGTLIINSSSDQVIMVLENLRVLYSEEGVPIDQGRVTVISQKKAKTNVVNLILDYSGKFNLTYDLTEETKRFSSSASPYTFVISNEGNLGGELVISIKDIERG